LPAVHACVTVCSPDLSAPGREDWDNRDAMKSIALFRNEKKVVEFAAGTPIFNEGDPSSSMYAVLDGSVTLTKGGQALLTLEVGEIFGEMGLVDDSPRSTAAVAASDVRLAVVDRQRFVFLVQEHPTFALQVMSVMAERLRNLPAS
jgi:CRP/FNR family cyclic AMP-dependent transcriptional regulator